MPASICLEIIDISGQFDDFLVSLRAPLGLCQVDSASGGSMRRNVWFGRGGAAHLLSEGVTLDGSGNPIVDAS